MRTRFSQVTAPRLAFRRLRERDLPLLHRWLHLPHVSEWWGRPGPTFEEVRAKYLPRIRGTSAVTSYVMLNGSTPIGYIQRYPVQDRTWHLEIDQPAVGMDLFIGETGYLGRGIGSEALRRFLREIVSQDASVTACFADPSSRNRAAIRAFVNAGFQQVAEASGPDPGAPVCVLRAVPAVTIVRYDPRWPAHYEIERQRIWGALADVLLAIEHVESTAVPGLAANPIIDLMAGVRTLEDAPRCIRALTALEYESVPQYETAIPARWYFRKPRTRPPTHHVHVVEAGGDFWRKHMLFRDYLRRHPDAAEAYADLKRGLAVDYRWDGASYTAGKSAFVRRVLERAGREV